MDVTIFISERHVIADYDEALSYISEVIVSRTVQLIAITDNNRIVVIEDKS